VTRVAARSKCIYTAWLPKVMAANKQVYDAVNNGSDARTPKP